MLGVSTPNILMSDLFHEEIEFAIIHKIFAIMQADWHEFQILTKRAERAALLSAQLPWPPNVWMGVSVEDTRVKHRIDGLRQTDAHIKFLSLEPLIGPLPDLDLTGIDWVIVGGESGYGAREIKQNWVVDIREQCKVAAVPFF